MSVNHAQLGVLDPSQPLGARYSWPRLTMTNQSLVSKWFFDFSRIQTRSDPNVPMIVDLAKSPCGKELHPMNFPATGKSRTTSGWGTQNYIPQVQWHSHPSTPGPPSVKGSVAKWRSFVFPRHLLPFWPGSISAPVRLKFPWWSIFIFEFGLK